MSTFARLAVVTFFSGLLSANPSSVIGGSPVLLGTKASKSVSMDQVDHSSWDTLLKKYVDPSGMVNYAAFKATPADIRQLDRYLAVLSSASPSVAASRPAQLAFWINAYNAVTLRGILREYPTSSIRNHTPKLWGYNIWKDLKLQVGGTPYSLEQIEHEILRKMSEPRIHFAIVCASLGCPHLLNEAFVADRITEQLQFCAKDFFRRSGNFRYDKSDQRFHLSSIMKWFATDFGADQRSQLSTIAAWLPTKDATDAARRGGVTVSYLDYDWNLNKQ